MHAGATDRTGLMLELGNKGPLLNLIPKKKIVAKIHLRDINIKKVLFPLSTIGYKYFFMACTKIVYL